MPALPWIERQVIEPSKDHVAMASRLPLKAYGHSKGTGPGGYWHVDGINESLEALLEAGAETQNLVMRIPPVLRR